MAQPTERQVTTEFAEQIKKLYGTNPVDQDHVREFLQQLQSLGNRGRARQQNKDLINPLIAPTMRILENRASTTTSVSAMDFRNLMDLTRADLTSNFTYKNIIDHQTANAASDLTNAPSPQAEIVITPDNFLEKLLAPDPEKGTAIPVVEEREEERRQCLALYLGWAAKNNAKIPNFPRLVLFCDTIKTNDAEKTNDADTDAEIVQKILDNPPKKSHSFPFFKINRQGISEAEINKIRTFLKNLITISQEEINCLIGSGQQTEEYKEMIKAVPLATVVVSNHDLLGYFYETFTRLPGGNYGYPASVLLARFAEDVKNPELSFAERNIAYQAWLHLSLTNSNFNNKIIVLSDFLKRSYNYKNLTPPPNKAMILMTFFGLANFARIQ